METTQQETGRQRSLSTYSSGSDTKPVRPPPPTITPVKRPDRPLPPPRPYAKSLSLPRGMKPMAAEAARAKMRAARRASEDIGLQSRPRSYVRTFSFSGHESKDILKSEQRQQRTPQEGALDQLVQELADKSVTRRLSHPSPEPDDDTTTKQTAPSRSLSLPDCTDVLAPTMSTGEPRVPSPVNDRSSGSSNSSASPHHPSSPLHPSPPSLSPVSRPSPPSRPTPPSYSPPPHPPGVSPSPDHNESNKRSPPTSKPPARPVPPRPFPPPTAAQLNAMVARKRPPPVLVPGNKKTGEQQDKPRSPTITVIDSRTDLMDMSNNGYDAPNSSALLSPSPADGTLLALDLQSSNSHPSSPTFQKDLDLSDTAKSEHMKQGNSSSESSEATGKSNTASAQKRNESTVNEQDTTTEQGSPQSKGRRFLNTMKKSLRIGGGRQRVTDPGRSKQCSPRSMRRANTTRANATHAATTYRQQTTYDDTVYPETLPQGVVSPLVVQCVAYLNREHVLKEEGLFRIPGDLAIIKSYRQKFVAGQDVDLTAEVFDPHTVAGLLKLHFREMRVSLISRGQTMADAVHAVQQKQVDEFREIIKNLDSSHVLTLRMLAELLCKISSYSDINHMTSGTLATSCGPSIFPYLPPSNANAIVKFLIDNCSNIFID